MDGELKGVICVTKKRFQEAPNKNLSRETKNLIVEKDKSVPEKEIDLLTYFKDFAHSQHTKKQQANITSTKSPSKLENFENSYFSYN